MSDTGQCLILKKGYAPVEKVTCNQRFQLLRDDSVEQPELAAEVQHGEHEQGPVVIAL